MAKAIDRPLPTAGPMMGPPAPSTPLLPHPFQPMLWLLDPAAEFLRPPVGVTKLECLKCWANSIGDREPQLKLRGKLGEILGSYQVSRFFLLGNQRYPSYLACLGNGNPLQYSCLENPMDGGTW